jgi:tetratricopeptide (TPR) repeat protein
VLTSLRHYARESEARQNPLSFFWDGGDYPLDGELLHVRHARESYAALSEGADPAVVAESLARALGSRDPALLSAFHDELAVQARHDKAPSMATAVAIQRLLVALGRELKWREGLVTGLNGLVHLLVDVQCDYRSAIVEFSAAERDLIALDGTAWTLICGDIGIAYLWLSEPENAARYLSVPIALAGILATKSEASRYLGNLGAVLAGQGFRDGAEDLIKRAISHADDRELKAKLEDDLRKLRARSD